MLNPLLLIQPTPKAERDATMLRFYSALDAMTRGEHPGEEEWRDMSDAVNLVETLVDMGRLSAEQVMPTVHSAVDVMRKAAHRYFSGQAMRVDGPGLQSLREVLDVYGQCMERLTGYEIAKAAELTQERIAKARRRVQSNPDEKVIML